MVVGGINAEIGARIERYRGGRGYKQPEFARAVGTSTRTLQRYEAGEKAVPIDKLIRMAEALGLSSPARLLYDEPPVEDVMRDVVLPKIGVLERRLDDLEHRR